MKYIYLPTDPEHYATGLRRDIERGTLKWDNANGQDSLLVQTPFGKKATDYIEQLCKKMPAFHIREDQYVEVLNQVWVRYYSATTKAKTNGCPLNGEACTYTVFACDTLGDECRIYAPKQAAMISPSCDIPIQVKVRVLELKKTGGLFRRKEISTGFFNIQLETDAAPETIGNGIQYSVEGLSIPITSQMCEMQSFYVKANEKPTVQALNPGIRLI